MINRETVKPKEQAAALAAGVVRARQSRALHAQRGVLRRLSELAGLAVADSDLRRLVRHHRRRAGAHTVAMNLTIWLEVAAAALALVALVTVAAPRSDAT
jgi:hypothetical protein